MNSEEMKYVAKNGAALLFVFSALFAIMYLLSLGYGL